MPAFILNNFINWFLGDGPLYAFSLFLPTIVNGVSMRPFPRDTKLIVKDGLSINPCAASLRSAVCCRSHHDGNNWLHC